MLDDLKICSGEEQTHNDRTRSPPERQGLSFTVTQFVVWRLGRGDGIHRYSMQIWLSLSGKGDSLGLGENHGTAQAMNELGAFQSRSGWTSVLALYANSAVSQ
jgi:hypothetical protein